MTLWDWIFALIFCGLGTIIIVGNWCVLIEWLVRKKSSSTIPFVGGMLLMVGLLIFTPLKAICWLGLVVDYGFWTGLSGLPHLIGERIKDIFGEK